MLKEKSALNQVNISEKKHKANFMCFEAHTQVCIKKIVLKILSELQTKSPQSASLQSVQRQSV